MVQNRMAGDTYLSGMSLIKQSLHRLVPAPKPPQAPLFQPHTLQWCKQRLWGSCLPWAPPVFCNAGVLQSELILKKGTELGALGRICWSTEAAAVNFWSFSYHFQTPSWALHLLPKPSNAWYLAVTCPATWASVSFPFWKLTYLHSH